MLENMSMQKRMILAAVLSVLFLVLYALLSPKRVPQKHQTQVAKINQKDETQAPRLGQKDETQAPIPSQQSSKQTPIVAIKNKATLMTIKSETFNIEIDTLGRISSKKLLEKKYLDKNNHPLEIVNKLNRPKPLEVRFSDPKLNKEALNTNYTADTSSVIVNKGRPVTVTLTQKLTSLIVIKKLTFFDDGHYDVDISLSNKKNYFISPGFRPNIYAKGFTVHGAIVQTSDDVLTIIEDGDSNEQVTFEKVRLAASFDRYYTTLFYTKKDNLTLISSPSYDNENIPILFIHAKENINFSGYIGPKEYKKLKAINPNLTKALEYGWFTFIAAPMFWLLQFFHDLVNNWGVAIIFVTFLTRIVLYPLTYRGMLSMQKLKSIAPQIKEIQKKHKGDPQKVNAATMALYKKYGANPLGGCLPLLLQIPIFFSIYRVLLNSVELQGASFVFWIKDLSLMDPYFIMPVMMGITMYYQQKITPTNFTDPMQEKIFKFLPLIFTFFFFTFPAGLVLYWTVNNLLSIAQQAVVNKKFKKLDILKHETIKEK